LLVGVSRYDDPDLHQLHAPAQDLAALARVLEDPEIGGYQLQRLLNAPVQRVREHIAELFADKGSDDRLLLYFSGHGEKDDAGELYLLATDTKRRRLNATAVSSTFIRQEVDHSQSKRIILLLDCCYGGAFSNDYLARRAGEKVDVLDRFLDRPEDRSTGRGRVVITASTAMQHAYEGNRYVSSGRPGPALFTGALVRGLESGEADRDQDGLISVDELYDYLYDEVRKQTPDQTPTKGGHIEGGLYVARSRTPRKPPPLGLLPPALYEGLEDHRASHRERTVHDLEALLASGSAEVAHEARQALERLREDDSRRVSSAAVAVLDRYDTKNDPQDQRMVVSPRLSPAFRLAELPSQSHEPVDSPIAAAATRPPAVPPAADWGEAASAAGYGTRRSQSAPGPVAGTAPRSERPSPARVQPRMHAAEATAGPSRSDRLRRSRRPWFVGVAAAAVVVTVLAAVALAVPAKYLVRPIAPPRQPVGLALDAAGNLYIADQGNHRVRKVIAGGRITTGAGVKGVSGAGGRITTAAGSGGAGFSGDGGLATKAQLGYPSGVAVDAKGNLYIAQVVNPRVRRVSADGKITTVAGAGVRGFSGDGGLATKAQLWNPSGVAVDALGNLYIADQGGPQVRKVSADGKITTVAGSGGAGFSGDGGLATKAQLWNPSGVAVDALGNLYIADQGNDRVRKVGTDGKITTIVG
jgi:sugar lactone lactonase YvrE